MMRRADTSIGGKAREFPSTQGQGTTYREVGEGFGITISTVRKRVLFPIQELRAIAHARIRDYFMDEKSVGPEFQEILNG